MKEETAPEGKRHKMHTEHTKLTSIQRFMRQGFASSASPAYLENPVLMSLVRKFASVAPAKPVLSTGEPKSYKSYNESGTASVLVIGDHAEKNIPRSLGALGLSEKDRARHIAVDIGSREVGVHISKALDAPAIFANYSRLVLDLNRGVFNPTQIAEASDETHIPGNTNLTHGEKVKRINEIFFPYHRKMEAMIKKFMKEDKVKLLLFVHSFTPEMNGFKRPWDIGVIWNNNERISQRYLKQLRQDNPAMTFGDNEPYSLRQPQPGNSIERHADANGLPYLVLEFRQDLVDTPEKAQQMAAIALKSLMPILEDKSFFKLGKKTASPSMKTDAFLFSPQLAGALAKAEMNICKRSAKPIELGVLT